MISKVSLVITAMDRSTTSLTKPWKNKCINIQLKLSRGPYWPAITQTFFAHRKLPQKDSI
jgi:hypothetical protein